MITRRKAQLSKERAESASTCEAIKLASRRTIKKRRVRSKSASTCEDIKLASRMTIKKRRVRSKPLGYFCMLPDALKRRIFSRCTFDSIGALSATSKAMKSKIKEYIDSPECHPEYKCALDNVSTYCDTPHFFKNLDILSVFVRQLNYYNPLMQKFEKIKAILNKLVFSDGDDEKQTNYYRCFGFIVTIVFDGCSKEACRKLITLLVEDRHLSERVLEVGKAEPGKMMKEEIEVRSFFRALFVDHTFEPHRSFWISIILSSFTCRQQINLLYIICGPMKDGRINWCPDSEESLDYHSAHMMFNELAFIVNNLNEKNEYLLAHLRDLPLLQRQETFASFLYFCGFSTTVAYLSELLQYEQLIPNVTIHVLHLGVVFHKFDSHVDSVLEIVKKIGDEPKLGLEFLKDFSETLVSEEYDYIIKKTDDDINCKVRTEIFSLIIQKGLKVRLDPARVDYSLL